MDSQKNITGIILAGGHSTRMGSDKGLLTLHGNSFTQLIINAIKPLVKTIIIVSNNPAYDIFDAKRVPDLKDNAGPLAGLFTGLHHSKSEINLVLSCDVPLITTKIVEKLINEIDDNADIIQLADNGMQMPLIAVYKKQCADMFLELLQQGERRLQTAVDHCKVKTVNIDDNMSYYIQNINTLEQLKQIT